MNDEDIDYVIYWVLQYFKDNAPQPAEVEEPTVEIEKPWWRFWE